MTTIHLPDQVPSLQHVLLVMIENRCKAATLVRRPGEGREAAILLVCRTGPHFRTLNALMEQAFRELGKFPPSEINMTIYDPLPDIFEWQDKHRTPWIHNSIDVQLVDLERDTGAIIASPEGATAMKVMLASIIGDEVCARYAPQLTALGVSTILSPSQPTNNQTDT